jgi:glucose-6-phosphate 1-dehydrogenase
MAPVQPTVRSSGAAAAVPPLVRAPDPVTIVIFGASGDLARRKLLPALYQLEAAHGLPERYAVVGFARSPMSDDAYRDATRAALEPAVGSAVPTDHPLLRALYYQAGDVGDAASLARLRARLEAIEREHGLPGNRLYYAAVAPQLFTPLVTGLADAGLIHRPGAVPWSRVIVEKPFGRDLASARALNATMRALLDESQIYRIDHYLGKETVQNLITFRFGNAIFEPLFNRRYVENVQITVAETVGMEGRRGAYFDTAGTLRDIVQNHMLQLLCLIAMEPPAGLEAEDIRDEKVKVLRAIRPPATAEEVAAAAVRGQYGRGEIDGRPVPGYREEPSVAPDSVTETFAALRLFIENWRWAEVPFYLRTGKRLAAHDTEIVVQFRRAPLALLPPEAGPQQPNRLTIHIQPDERITLRIEAKRPGPHLRMVPVELQFAYQDLEGDSRSTGYETLLYDCMVGDPMLFHRADMVEAAWTVVMPVLEAWAAAPPRDFPNYAAGSWGPEAADRLLTRDGRRWVPPS